MASSRRPQWLLIALTVLIAMGHVCALPGHIHAALPSAHHEHHEAHQHQPPPDGESHLESCEGLRSAPVNLGIVLAMVPQPTVTVVDPRAPRLLERSSFVAASPPLFLLHASLLI